MSHVRLYSRTKINSVDVATTITTSGQIVILYSYSVYVVCIVLDPNAPDNKLKVYAGQIQRFRLTQTNTTTTRTTTELSTEDWQMRRIRARLRRVISRKRVFPSQRAQKLLRIAE